MWHRATELGFFAPSVAPITTALGGLQVYSDCGIGKFMAKITWQTTFSYIRYRGGQSTTFYTSETGTFQIIKFGGFGASQLFLYDASTGQLYPMSAVNRMDLA